MKILVFLVLFAASTWGWVNTPQAGPPKESNGETKKTTGDPKPSQGKLRAPLVVPADINKNDASNPQDVNQNRRVSVPPVQPVAISNDKGRSLGVNTVKDSWDKALVIGTVLLVVAGGLGIKYAVKTLRQVEKQAGLMDGQLKEMQKQAGFMDTQARLMAGQLGEMQAAGKQIGEQIELARRNIDLILSKERSHLRVELEKLDIPADSTDSVVTVEYTVKLYGPTLVTVVESEVSSTIEDTDSPPTGPYLGTLFIPTIITPSDGPQKARTIIIGHSDEGAQDDKTIEDVKAGRKFVHCWGYIHYRDVFGRDQWTRFRNVWKYDPWESMGKFGDWRPCGPQEDNSST
jgi:hypothetical protein